MPKSSKQPSSSNSGKHQMQPPSGLSSSNRDKNSDKKQSIEGLAQIPHFIQDHIFPLLCGRDQLQLAKASNVLLKELKQDLPPKVICAKCLKTLISGAALPEHVSFLQSSESYNTTVAIVFCQDVTNNPFDSDGMAWAREKFSICQQQHKGTPLLLCSRCRNIVAILLTTSTDDPKLKCLNWTKASAQSNPSRKTYKLAHQIFPLHSGTKYVGE